MSGRILLVSPSKTQEASYSEMFQDGDVVGAAQGGPLKATMAPVELATLAALAPPGFEIDVWDEAVAGKITGETKFAHPYDLVGVTGYLVNVIRMLELRDEFHRRGALTVAGGPAVSNSPERFRGIYDVIFLGEAEFTWPRFLREWQAGQHSSEYRQIERPDLADSPVPDWGKVANVGSAYVAAGVQTTRGCPFDCEFCDVIHLFGRKPRHKPIDAVLEEVRQLERLGVRRVFFCDDNFIGDPHYARQLLQRLVPLNQSFARPIGFISQFTINVAREDDILRLLADANFTQLYIGIETPRKASLVEVHKLQNTRGDLVDDVRKIQSYGLFVSALMMVGFDNDDPSIFDELYEFIQSACITQYRLHQLQSFPGTPQTARLLKAGRVLEMDGGNENFGVSNILPAQMTRAELFEGYLDVQRRLLDWRAFGDRLLGAIRQVSYVPGHARRKIVPPERRARAAKAVRRIMQARAPVRKLAAGLLAIAARIGSRRAAAGDTASEGGRHPAATLAALLKHLDSMEPGVRETAAAVVSESIERAPWIAKDMLVKVVMHPHNIRGVDRMAVRLRDRLAMEQQPGYKHKIAAAVQIPPDFKRIYKEQFAITLRWLRDGLTDHGLVAEGLVRVWKDFVIRYGATFTKFEDYHISSLKELVERTIEQGNSGQFSHSRSMAAVDNLSSFQIHVLSEQIMFSVEQDLKSGQGEELVKLTMGPVDAHRLAAAG